MPLTFRVPLAARVRPTALTIALVALMLGGPAGSGGVRPVASVSSAVSATSVVSAISVVSATSVVSARPAGPAPSAGARFRWPLDGHPPVVRRFAPPPRPWLPGHRGVDLSAEPGAAVYAAGPGTVRFAGLLAGRGVVSIEHADGLRTTYEPVTAAVAAGQRLRAGDVIGTLDAGHVGCPAVSCLHWGLRRGAVYLDPLALVGAARVRLLPLTPSSR